MTGSGGGILQKQQQSNPMVISAEIHNPPAQHRSFPTLVTATVADSASSLNIVVTRERQRRSVFGSLHPSAAPCCKFITSKSAFPTATTTTTTTVCY